MKIFGLFSVLYLFCCAADLTAQQNTGKCTDIVYLRGGSELRGTIIEYSPEGSLVIATWSGTDMTIPSGNVTRIVQRCKEEKQKRLYDFKEHGLYNATRMGALIGQTYYGDNTAGFTLYHSIGWMFNRWAGAGIGGGAEIFSPDSNEPATYPVFAEVRGYLTAKNVAPFYTLGAGWAFAGKNTGDQWVDNSEWGGGWLAKAQIGYRLGNHFTLFGGLYFQKKTRTWNSAWGGEWGQDHILHKRLELGFGILL